MGDTTALTYTDKTVKSGVKYTYTVRRVASDGKVYTSGYNTAGITGQCTHTHNWKSDAVTHTETVHHDAVTHTETISNGYTCTRCGQHKD